MPEPPPAIAAARPADEWSTGRHGRWQMLYGCMLCRATVKRAGGDLPHNGKDPSAVSRNPGPPWSLAHTPTSLLSLPRLVAKRKRAERRWHAPRAEHGN